MLCEDQVGLTEVTSFNDDKPDKLAIIIHPPFQGDDVAYMFVDPSYNSEEEDEFACFYCGLEKGLESCTTCRQVLCRDCDEAVGCTCMLADGMQATVDSFVPKPGRSKTTTFNKAQKKNVMRGVNTVAK